MNAARDNLCLGCGQYVHMQGMYSMRNHLRRCAVNVPHESEEDIVQSLGDDVAMVDAEDNGGFAAADGVPAVLSTRHLGVITGLDDFDHLNEYMNIGRLECSEQEMQLMKFMHMNHSGYGVSRAFSFSRCSSALAKH